MAVQNSFDIIELSEDERAVSNRKYRKTLHYVAQSAIWIGYLYFLVRVSVLLCSPSKTWQIWAMLAVELVLAYLARNEHLLSAAASKIAGAGQRKRLRLQGTENLPRVDVLLPCCGEPEDVIMETVRAACTLDYPMSQFRVLLLDDGGSALLKKKVSELSSQWPHLSYHSRGRQSGQVFAKSGNLNYAIGTLQKEDPPEFCAVLDADSIPKPEFLRAILPHLLQNPEAALVCTRQYFDNLPSGDQLSQARCHFYTCQNAALDILGCAIDAGSGAVFRRECIVQIGMYPTFSFSEDWQLSLVLRGFGHRVMQVQERLQFGLVPTSITGHIAQRNRWNIGHAQQVVSMLSSNAPNYPKALQRSIAWNGAGVFGGEVIGFFAFSMIPVLLLSGKVIPTTSSFLTSLQLVLALTYLLLTWSYEYVQAAYTGFESAPFAHLENKWLALGNIYAVLRFYLFSSKPKGSFVTGSTANSWNRSTMMSSYMKIYTDLWQNGIFCNVVTLALTLGAVFYSSATIMSPNEPCWATEVFTSFAWPPLLNMCYLSIVNNWVPITYLLNPPVYPSRKSQAPQSDSNKKDMRQNKWSAIDKAGRDMITLGSRLDLVDEAEL
ncbi:nucleotide-diphospho-sugar transferase [Penicillium herquei]|nr:nucleotide-diphospho-sugar transferase [Penicillium herquei]